MLRMSQIALVLGLLAAVGCVESSSKPTDDNSGKGIIGKKTQDIGEFDGNKANQVVSDTKIRATDPISAPLSAYGPMVEKISMIQITNALELFRATEDRYPKDHEEFMQRIIKENNIQLPVLPYKGKYQYDVENHELKAVYDRENAAKKDGN
jgi:hypothetical protein